MVNSRLMVALALCGGLFGMAPAWAHGEAKARHGGVVQKAKDLSFELVPQAGGAAIFIEDHGKPLAVTGIGGKLTVLNGADKREAELKPAGDRLEAQGVKLAAGSKAVASVTLADKQTLTLRFVVK